MENIENISAINPMLPWQLPWQQKPWQQFSTNFQENRLHHAWIIEGDDGYAINSFVLNLVKLVNCEQVNSGKPCESCLSCTQIESGNYPDFIKVSLQEKKVQIGVDQIREINNILFQKAYSGKYRVVVIEQAELMNTASANAFLKTLEEPGDQTLLILQTPYPSRLLATLRSRCQMLSLTATRHQVIYQWLQQRTANDNPQQLAQAFQAAGYKPLLTEQFLLQNVAQKRQQFFNAVDELLAQSIQLSQFEKQQSIETQLQLAWLEQYLFNRFSENYQYRTHLESFYSVLQEIRLQSLRAREADKPLLLREIFIKWIALFAKLSHS